MNEDKNKSLTPNSQSNSEIPVLEPEIVSADHLQKQREAFTHTTNSQQSSVQPQPTTNQIPHQQATSYTPPAPSIPTPPPAPEPQVRTEYIKVKEKSAPGFGVLGWIFWKIVNLVGCLLFMVSLIIVGFVIYINI